MTKGSLNQIAKDGYAIWRGTYTGAHAPCTWEELTERQRAAFMAVAAYATVQTLAEAARHPT